MDCKEMILSEDTYDIITDFSASEFLGDDNNCYERIGEDFLILYLGNLGIRNPKIDFFPYHNMPKLYGLMQLSFSVARSSPASRPHRISYRFPPLPVWSPRNKVSGCSPAQGRVFRTFSAPVIQSRAIRSTGR